MAALFLTRDGQASSAINRTESFNSFNVSEMATTLHNAALKDSSNQSNIEKLVVSGEKRKDNEAKMLKNDHLKHGHDHNTDGHSHHNHLHSNHKKQKMTNEDKENSHHKHGREGYVYISL